MLWQWLLAQKLVGGWTPPLWKIWVCHLGWFFHSQLNGKKTRSKPPNMFEPIDLGPLPKFSRHLQCVCVRKSAKHMGNFSHRRVMMRLIFIKNRINHGLDGLNTRHSSKKIESPNSRSMVLGLPHYCNMLVTDTPWKSSGPKISHASHQLKGSYAEDWRSNHQTQSGWWLQPLWKILFSWDD